MDARSTDTMFPLCGRVLGNTVRLGSQSSGWKVNGAWHPGMGARNLNSERVLAGERQTHRIADRVGTEPHTSVPSAPAASVLSVHWSSRNYSSQARIGGVAREDDGSASIRLYRCAGRADPFPRRHGVSSERRKLRMESSI